MEDLIKLWILKYIHYACLPESACVKGKIDTKNVIKTLQPPICAHIHKQLLQNVNLFHLNISQSRQRFNVYLWLVASARAQVNTPMHARTHTHKHARQCFQTSRSTLTTNNTFTAFDQADATTARRIDNEAIFSKSSRMRFFISSGWNNTISLQKQCHRRKCAWRVLSQIPACLCMRVCVCTYSNGLPTSLIRGCHSSSPRWMADPLTERATVKLTAPCCRCQALIACL